MTQPDPQYDELREQLETTPPAAHSQLAQQLHDRYLQLERGGAVDGLPYPDPTDPLSEGADAIRALAEAVAAGIQALNAAIAVEHPGIANGGARLLLESTGDRLYTTPASLVYERSYSLNHPTNEGASRIVVITSQGTFGALTSLINAGYLPKVMNLNGVNYGTGNPSGGADGDIYYRLV